MSTNFLLACLIVTFITNCSENKEDKPKVLSGWSQLPLHLTVSSAIPDPLFSRLGDAVSTWNKGVGMDVLVVTKEDRPYVVEKNGNPDWGEGNRIFFLKYTDASGSCSFFWGGKAVTTGPGKENETGKFFGNVNISLNACVDWLSPVTQTCPQGQVATDFETVILHELGHALGLDHVEPSEDPNSIMRGNQCMYTGPLHVPSERDFTLLKQINGFSYSNK
jgi:hypothetical protein